MKNLLNIKSLGYGILIAAAVTFTISQSACKKKVDPEPEKDKKVADPKDTAATVDYIKFDGYRLEMKNPAKGTLKDDQGEISYSWRGNKPASIDGDTTLYINHSDVARKVSTYTTFTAIPFNEGEVGIEMQWGTSFGKPLVKIKSGTYKLERINGFWVSTLTNGTGDWDRGSGDIKTYTGIEFRATWPD